MDKEEETAFMQVFPIVLGSLILFTVIIFVIARFIAPGDMRAADADPRVLAMIDKRIEPVGRVRTSPPDPSQMQASAQAPSGPMSGEQVYNAACAACHATGVLQAPRFRNTEDWALRMGKGIDGLVASAIAGINQMPARGGNPNLKDEEIRAAVEHMLAQ